MAPACYCLPRHGFVIEEQVKSGRHETCSSIACSQSCLTILARSLGGRLPRYWISLPRFHTSTITLTPASVDSCSDDPLTAAPEFASAWMDGELSHQVLLRMDMSSTTATLSAMTSTIPSAVASASASSGMSMGDMGGNSCKISMTWNWYTVDACEWPINIAAATC